MNDMQRLTFSTNWNNKLDCGSFTTIRLSGRFNIGEEIEVFFRDNRRAGRFKIIGKKRISLDGINDWIAYIDTGYSAVECKDILRKMYKKSVKDWTNQSIYYYLISKFKTEKKPEPSLFSGENEKK